MRSRSQDIVLDFRSAQTKEQLRFELAKLQQELGGEVKFLSVYFDGKEHVAWFFNQIDMMVLNEELLKKK